MADSRLPAFDRNGKYLYFTASTNAGATSSGLDMSGDLYEVRSSIYAVVLAADQTSPVAPELNDEKIPAQKQPKLQEPDQTARGNEPVRGSEWRRTSGASGAAPAPAPIGVKIDLNGIGARIVALPLPSAAYVSLAAGPHGSLYF